MRCPNCGNEIGPAERFCSRCGAPRPRLPPHFADVETRFEALNARLQAGQIDKASFEAQRGALAVRGPNGSYWSRKGVDAGTGTTALPGSNESHRPRRVGHLSPTPPHGNPSRGAGVVRGCGWAWAARRSSSYSPPRWSSCCDTHPPGSPRTCRSPQPLPQLLWPPRQRAHRESHPSMSPRSIRMHPPSSQVRPARAEEPWSRAGASASRSPRPTTPSYRAGRARPRT